MGNIIEIRGLKKSYGSVKAVDDVSFDVEEGSLFAFLGINGAGKSTTINVICTLLSKDSGSVMVAGHSLDTHADKIRSDIGVVFQGSILDKTLSVKDNLLVRASFYGIHGKAFKTRLRELSDLLELSEILSRPYGKLSGGQRRRVDIARGLINAPKVLILDEPTTGLDPSTRKTVWGIVNNLRKSKAMTVFLTTHYMEEADQADRVVIIDAGKIAAQGTPVELKNKFSSDYIKLYADKSATLDAKLKDYKFVYEGNFYRIFMADSTAAKAFVLKFGDILQNFEIVKGNMDDVFLNITGKQLVGGEHA